MSWIPRLSVPTQESPSSSSSYSNNDDASEFAKMVIKHAVLSTISMVCAGVVGFYLFKTLSSDTNSSAAVQSREALAKRLRRPEVATMVFDSYEMRLIPEVLGAEEISIGFNDVGGLDSAIEEVKDNVVLPLQIWKYHKSYSSISPCPSGVLLYGPPGTGKSLIAKAIAKEAGTTFISIQANAILDKYFGESERMAAAIFNLGRKLAPTIIFIDEIETLLQKRGSADLGVVQNMKSIQGIFLAEWDGLSNQRKESSSLQHGPVVVLGATNRPNDLDPAFLRRMPVQLAISLPDATQRLAIFKAQLRTEDVDPNVDLKMIADQMNGASGSDIKEIIRLASLRRTKEVTAAVQKRILEMRDSTPVQPSAGEEPIPQPPQPPMPMVVQRPLNREDFDFALEKTKHHKSHMDEFKKGHGPISLQDLFRTMFGREEENEGV